MEDDDLIEKFNARLGDIGSAISDGPSAEFEACRVLIRDRIQPWSKLASLANGYVMARRNMLAGDQRTAVMTRFANNMQEYADLVDTDDFGGLLAGRNAGRRLIACAVLSARPDAEQLPAVVRAAVEEPQPFVQYWALRALWSMVQNGAVLSDGNRERLSKLTPSVRGDESRSVLLVRLLAFRRGPLAGKRVLLQGDMYEALAKDLQAAGAAVDSGGVESFAPNVDLVVATFPPNVGAYNASSFIANLRGGVFKAPIVFYMPNANVSPVASWTDNAVFFADLSELRAAVLDWRWAEHRQGPSDWVLVAGTGRSSGLPENVQIGAEMVGRAVADAGMGLITGGWPGVDYIAAREFTAAVERFGVPVELGLLHNIDMVPKADFPQGRAETFAPGEALQASVVKAAAVMLVGGEGGTWEVFQAAVRAGKIILPLASSGGDAARAWKLLRLASGYSNIESATAPLSDRSAALGQGKDRLIRDLTRMGPLTDEVGRLVAFLVSNTLPAVEEYMRPGTLAELDIRSERVRDDLKYWSGILPQAVPTLVGDEDCNWRVAGYLGFQVHPDPNIVPPVIAGLWRERDLMEARAETRPFFQWLSCVYVSVTQFRSRVPADLGTPLRSVLEILEARSEIDAGGQCKNLAREILGLLERGGPALRM